MTMPRDLPPELSRFQKLTGLFLGKQIHYGGDPTAYIHQLKDDHSKLVKIVNCTPDELKANLPILRYLKKQNNPAVVKLYKIGAFKASSTSCYDCLHYEGLIKCRHKPHQEQYYYYVMDKLKQNIRQVKPYLYQFDQALGKGEIYRQVNDGAAFSIHFADYGAIYHSKTQKSNPKAELFLKYARQLKYRYLDIHEWNVLFDDNGNFKLVDLESFGK